MLNYPKTISVVSSFYEECVKFWEREGKQHAEAVELAKKDIEGITTNPYSPKGEELDKEAKQAFLTILTII